VKFVNSLVKRKSIERSLLSEVLSEVQRPVSCHQICILFDEIDQIAKHLTLRACIFDIINIVADSGIVIGMVF